MEKIKLSKYMKGKGLDISEGPGPDNLYSLRDLAKPESLDFVYSDGLINKTKFYRILIKEMFIYCKVGGNIIIKMQPNEILKFQRLINECKFLLKDKIKIIKTDYNWKTKTGTIILKKTKAFLKKGDSVDKWTFGIITNGKRNDWIEKQIKSIKKQKIPHYEIIVCGTYFKRKEKNFTYIPFSERDEIGWITKKKNLICEAAKYENLMILHDRIFLNDGWYKGMKKHNNYFEAITCPTYDEQGQRTGDWNTYGNKLSGLPRMAVLEYRDWDKYAVIVGGMTIFKRSIWEQVKWNEGLYYGWGEDIRLSYDLHKAGFVQRVNVFSPCTALSWNGGAWDTVYYIFDPKKLGKRRNVTFDYQFVMYRRYIGVLIGSKKAKDLLKKMFRIKW